MERSIQIAVIGWGSLIWCPGALKVKSKWHRDGPSLPVEFARVSKDKRLTLVLLGDVDCQPTLWALSGYADINKAKENLCKREGTISKYIGSWSRGYDASNGIEDLIAQWFFMNKLDGAVWTDLPPKDQQGTEKPMTAGQAVKYLQSLKGLIRKRAKEYVMNTPTQINTAIRRRLRSDMGWTDKILPIGLFED